MANNTTNADCRLANLPFPKRHSHHDQRFTLSKLPLEWPATLCFSHSLGSGRGPCQFFSLRTITLALRFRISQLLCSNRSAYLSRAPLRVQSPGRRRIHLISGGFLIIRNLARVATLLAVCIPVHTLRAREPRSSRKKRRRKELLSLLSIPEPKKTAGQGLGNTAPVRDMISRNPR